MQQPLRIAQVMGKMVGGGVEAVVMNYYRNIDRTKIQFDFLVDSDSTNIPKEEIEALGGRVIIVPPYQKIVPYIRDLKKVLKKNQYQIVHSHINTLSVFPLYAAKSAGVPIRIAHSHSTSNKKEKKKDLMKKVLRPFSKLYATDYYCCSEYAGRYLFGNKAFNHGKVTLINNAIELDKFIYNEKIRLKIRKELGLENKLVIGHVGRFISQKNHDKLIDIFDTLSCINNTESVLLLIGEGSLMEEIKRKVTSLNLQDKVMFLGQRTDVNDLMQAMDIFLLPSLYEGLPVVGVEAQTSGLLCILSDAMTKETKVLRTTEFIELDKSSAEWAKIILKKYKIYKRTDTKKQIQKSGFDIKIEAQKLQDKYIKLFQRLVK